MAEINVTPMVDVMLVLLIIFMVTAPLLTVGVPLDLPQRRPRPRSGQGAADGFRSTDRESISEQHPKFR
jgi:biopolymer transport protein ExbD